MAYEDLLKDTSVAVENGNYFNLTLTDLNPSTYYPIQLRWKYKDGTFSEWSAVKTLNSVTVPLAPSVLPSTPTVKPIVGAIELAWNGKTSTGADQPYGFNSAKVYVGTTSNFVPVDSGSTKNLVDILNFANGQNTLNIGVGTVVNSSLTLTYGIDYYVKIKTTNGNTAEDSTEVSATGNPVRIGQLSNAGLVEVSADKITTGTLQSASTVTVGSTAGKHVIIRGTGNPLSIYGSGGTAGGTILDFDGIGNLSIKGTIDATAGAFTGAISMGSGGSMKIGVGVSSGNDGIYIGTNNYWYNTGYFKVGDGTNSVSWNGTTLEVIGTIKATGGFFGTSGGTQWTIGSTGITASGAAVINMGTTAKIIVGDYFISSSGTDFVVRQTSNDENIIRTESKSGATDSPLRVLLGGSGRQVEVVQSAQISGNGTTASDGTSQNATNAYRSGGLRNMYTVANTFTTTLYPSALSGDVLLVYDSTILT
jgi:hypothetical protein